MRKGLLLAAGLGVLAVLVYLYTFEPGGSMPYPRCWFHALTGLYCPGCGATRCLHALLHGELAQAAAFNVLFLLCLPFLLYAGLRWMYYCWRAQSLPVGRIPRWWWPGVCAAIILFGILRNLPFAPFCLLAPHPL